MTRRYSSTAQATTLAAGCTDSATSIQVTATTGFPAVEFTLALDYGAAGQEIVLVTNVSGTTLTVTRGFDSTPASAHSLGAVVQHVHCADDFTDFRTHEAATAAHGIAGAVVGTTDTQALSNKDLSSGTNTFPATLAAASDLSTHIADTTAHGATGNVVGTSDAQTLTNKTIALGSNTVSGTTAQFNSANSDGDFATLAGTETLTNKTLTSPSIASPTFTGDHIGKVTRLKKTVDESVSTSTTFQDDDTLQFSAAANAVYEIKYAVRFTRTVNTCGRKYQIVGPAGSTGGVMTTTTLSSSPFVSGSQVPDTGSGGGTDSSDETFSGTLQVETSATAGTVSLQYAQHTSHASALLCKAGSFMTVTRVG